MRTLIQTIYHVYAVILTAKIDLSHPSPIIPLPFFNTVIHIKAQQMHQNKNLP